MFSMIRQLFCATSRFVRREDGATSVEYAVMLALIISVIFGTIGLLGLEIAGAWNASEGSITQAFDFD